jgi:hypothetical protein
MNINLLKLADKDRYPRERAFKSLKDDTVLYASSTVDWCGCGRTLLSSNIIWDILQKICIDIPFSGWYIIKSGLDRSEIIDWIKEHLEYGKEV